MIIIEMLVGTGCFCVCALVVGAVVMAVRKK